MRERKVGEREEGRKKGEITDTADTSKHSKETSQAAQQIDKAAGAECAMGLYSGVDQNTLH